MFRRYPKAYQLFEEDRNRFCRGHLAKDEDYRPIHWRHGAAMKWSAVGAILLCHRHPEEAVIRLSEALWWRDQPRRMWPYLSQWWSDHTDSYVVMETLRRLGI